MRKKIYACLSVLAAVALSLLSCQKAEGPAMVGDGAARLTFIATLGSSAVSGTRADDDLSRDDHYDKWSYEHFNRNDKLGFFASHGNSGENNGEGPIINWPLICMTDKPQGPYQFESDELFSFTHLDTKEIFLYYPYQKDIAEENGMELRRKSILKEETTEVERCVDFLVGKGIEAPMVEGKMLLSGTMAHAFSELIIVRGKGFDRPPQGRETITVVMQQPYSHIRINCSTEEKAWSCKPELIYDSSLNSEEEYRKWEAWQGTNFGITEENPTGVQAWYALLPTLEGNRSAVAYIEIYDNEGELRKVSSLKLADNGKSKYLDPGWQYPMQISIEELVPTVNPYPIIPWNNGGEDTDLTNERKRGIHSLADFEMWQLEYTRYLASHDNREELLKYGDLTTDADGTNPQWHFYILNDIDFTEYPYDAVAVIPELRDILDGVSTTLDNHTFLNHKLKGLKRPLVGNLSGSLLNMDFINPDIALESTAPVGVLANAMTDATVDNCTVDNGTVRSAGPVGMAAGSISGGSVKKSSFSGFMVGTRSHAPDGGDASIRYLFGMEPTNTPALNGNFSEVQFSPLNN